MFWTPAETNPEGSTFGKKVRVIAGTKSKYVLPEKLNQYLKWFPGMDLRKDVRWVEAGHWLHSEKPKEFLEQTDGFMN